MIMATILQRLKAQLEVHGVDTSNVKTITQALKKFEEIEVPPDGEVKHIEGNTISECLDDVMLFPVWTSTSDHNTGQQPVA